MFSLMYFPMTYTKQNIYYIILTYTFLTYTGLNKTIQIMYKFYIFLFYKLCNTFNIPIFFLGILPDDQTTFPTPHTQLSVSQQYMLQYIVQILTTMERVSDNYNEDDIDEDNYEHFQVHLLIMEPFT